MTSPWLASKDYFSFSIFSRPQFECVTWASALIDVAKNARCPLLLLWKKCVLECLWITFHGELLEIAGVCCSNQPPRQFPVCAHWLPFCAAGGQETNFQSS